MGFTPSHVTQKHKCPDFNVRCGGKDKTKVWLKGEPRLTFMRETKLTVTSHPVEWVNAFFPVYGLHNKSKGETPYELSSEKLCMWSNFKAALMEMGTKKLYAKFKPFATQEWDQYLYLFFLNGLAPSPQIEMKLYSEEKNPIHSNVFLRRELGGSSPQRLREWKCCFATQDRRLAILSRKTHPNFRGDEYFWHLQKIFRHAWVSGKHLSGDEQTMGFQGSHADKLRITYKKEGDGFQYDYIADDGYTFTLFFRNQPVQKKWLDKGYSPLH